MLGSGSTATTSRPRATRSPRERPGPRPEVEHPPPPRPGDRRGAGLLEQPRHAVGGIPGPDPVVGGGDGPERLGTTGGQLVHGAPPYGRAARVPIPRPADSAGTAHGGFAAGVAAPVATCETVTDHERRTLHDRPPSRSPPVAHVAAPAAPCALRPPRREVVSISGHVPPTSHPHRATSTSEAPAPCDLPEAQHRPTTRGQERHATDRGPGPHQEPRDAGRGGHLRPPRRRHPARLRPHPRLVDPPRPRPPRAGGGPHGRGLRPRDGPARRGHGHERARAPPTSSPRWPTP